MERRRYPYAKQFRCRYLFLPLPSRTEHSQFFRGQVAHIFSGFQRFHYFQQLRAISGVGVNCRFVSIELRITSLNGPIRINSEPEFLGGFI